jgi:hypothetical protein
MNITINVDEKKLQILCNEMELDLDTVKADIQSYFESYEYNSDLIAELIENVITNY